MDSREYADKVRGLINPMGSLRDDLMHMGAGFSGEAGEVLDEIKKHFAYGRPLNTAKVLEEAGDALFYLTGLLGMLGVTIEDVRVINIKKLETRYPELRFDAERANNRDVDAEHKAMTA